MFYNLVRTFSVWNKLGSPVEFWPNCHFLWDHFVFLRKKLLQSKIIYLCIWYRLFAKRCTHSNTLSKDESICCVHQNSCFPLCFHHLDVFLLILVFEWCQHSGFVGGRLNTLRCFITFTVIPKLGLFLKS